MNCAGCPFAGGATCGSRGPIDAPIVVVGQSPGVNEVLQGKPFIGASGKLLDQALIRAGVEGGSSTFFVTNAISCLPSDSNIPSEAIMACQERLYAELRAAPRTLIIGLGAVALKSITNDMNARITQVRGHIIKTEFGPLIATLHPAAVMRNENDLPRFKSDIGHIADFVLRGERRTPGQTMFAIINSEEDFSKYARYLKEAPFLAADIETSALDLRTDIIIAIGVAYARNRVLVFTDKAFHLLAPYFKDPNIRWVWHNGKFDTSFLRRDGYEARQDEDTMLMHYAIDESRGTHDLKQLATSLLGADDYEQPIKEALRAAKKAAKGGPVDYSRIPRITLLRYLAKDADYTYQLYERFSEEFAADPELRQVYDALIMPSARFLQNVEEVGMHVDLERLNEIGRVLDKEIAEARAATMTAVSKLWDTDRYVKDVGAKKPPLDFNPASSRHIHWLLFNRLHLQIPNPRLPTNTSQRVLESLTSEVGIAVNKTDAHVSFIENLLLFRKKAKEKSTYVDGIIEALDDNNRVHTTFHVPGTTTGRLSSSSPNLQNQPKESLVRSAFTAPEGRILIDGDLSQAELRGLAHLSGDQFFIDVYQGNRDLHDEVALALFGGGFSSEQRRRAKAFNFGVMYGRTKYGLMKEFQMSEQEAGAMIDAWFARCPGAAAYFRWSRQQAYSGRTLVSPFGRRRHFRLITNENYQGIGNEAANFSIQSMASDIMLVAAMYAAVPLSQIDAYIINLVHDSIVVEAPDDSDAVASVTTIIRDCVSFVTNDLLRARVPFPVEFEIGHVWSKEGMTKWKPND